MFIQPILGSIICYAGKQLLFHSAPEGLWQYEHLESGEFFKWDHEDFVRKAGSGAIAKVETVGNRTSIVMAEPLPSQHQAMLIGLTAFESAEQARFAQAFMAFQRSGLDLQKDPDGVKSLVDTACLQMGFKSVSVRQLKGIRAKYRRHGDLLYACTPQRRGVRMGHYKLCERDEDLIDRAINEHYLKLEQPSIGSAFRHYLRMREDDQTLHGKIANLPASQRTFERRVGRLESFNTCERRHGTHEAKRMHRLVRGVYCDVYPMEVGEMDDCYLPVMVVSDDYSHALGVPRLCCLRDRGTAYAASFFLWCGEVSTFTALATFRNLLTDKAPLLRGAGLPEGAWPYCGTFGTIVMDRGPNLNAESVVRAATCMDSSVQITATKQPWKKPFVERLHGYILEYIATELPGRMFDDVVSFRSYKAKAKAIIPLSALIRILVEFFVNVINGVPRRGHKTTPTEEMTAWLRDHPPAVPCDPARIDLMTSMVITRVVNQEGIRWENLHYVSDELAALVRRIGHGAKLSVRVNLADLAKVTVVDPHTGELIPAHCTWKSYAAKLSLPEHQLLCRSLRARREKIRLSALIGLQRRIAAELASARLGKKLGEIAQKAERMQQSSESCAQVEDATEAPPPTRPPADVDEMLSASNRSVLDSFLF
jgi:hypothetical protein